MLQEGDRIKFVGKRPELAGQEGTFTWVEIPRVHDGKPYTEVSYGFIAKDGKTYCVDFDEFRHVDRERFLE